ncbi:hypothetical protein STEG23_029600 [Scotinomys teguina]
MALGPSHHCESALTLPAERNKSPDSSLEVDFIHNYKLNIAMQLDSKGNEENMEPSISGRPASSAAFPFRSFSENGHGGGYSGARRQSGDSFALLGTWKPVHQARVTKGVKDQRSPDQDVALSSSTCLHAAMLPTNGLNL